MEEEGTCMGCGRDREKEGNRVLTKESMQASFRVTKCVLPKETQLD